MAFLNEQGLERLWQHVVVKIDENKGYIADKAVTRAKLADNALYSPMKGTADTTSYYFVVDDLGKTVAPSYAAADLDIEYTLTSEVAAALPYGAEIAVLYRYGTSLKIIFETDAWSAIVGDTAFTSGKTYSIPERFGMVVLKKVDTSSSSPGRTYWLVTGNVEVVN